MNRKGNFETKTTLASQRLGIGDPENHEAVWKNDEDSPLSSVLTRNPNFRVLIVDDNKPIRLLIRSILSAFGVKHVDEAGDGAEAIRGLHVLLPDLVITDLEMEPMNGLEFTRQIRNNSQSPNADLPIVIMTGHTEKRRILEIRQAGLTEVMAKPVVPKLLSRNILAAMKNYEHRMTAKNGAAPGATDEEDYFDI